MPLIVPGPAGLSSKSKSNPGENQTERWTNLLVGKSLTDDAKSTETHFSKKELPESHRVLGPDSVWTLDFRPDRLNVHLNKDGIVEKVSHG